MKKQFLFFWILMVQQIGFAQNNLSWRGYFSYSGIKAISQSPTTIFAASENALFSKSTLTNQLKTTNTVDGLSGQTMSTLYYSSIVNKTIVGYENGLLIVINEQDGSMVNVVDIIQKQLPSNLKKINHFMEFEGIIYISCDFGIVQFNPATMQFGDTYFIGDNGVEVSVKQTAVANGYIYAATSNGIKRAVLSSKNLIDFNQWTLIGSGNWSNIASFSNALFAINSSGNIHKFNTSSNTFVSYLQLPESCLDFRATADYLFVTTAKSVAIYNKQMALLRQINSSQMPEENASFTCATSIGELVYLGTKEHGLQTTSLSMAGSFENITPNGPSRNAIFALEATSDALWATYGGYSSNYNPYVNGGPSRYGISKLISSGWMHIPYEKMLGARAISRIMVNPSNEKEVFASSFFSGLLKIVDDVPTFLYNQTNSGLESLVLSPPNPSYIDVRINATVFDKSGNLWVTNSLVNKGLKVFRTNGQWQSFDMSTMFLDIGKFNLPSIVIDKNGIKWLATGRDGVVGFNESTNKFKKMTVGPDAGNLPFTDVRALAIDAKNQLWIGTTRGLRVLSNVANFQTDAQLKSNPIIIVEDNLAQELLYEQFITDIVVDGANNKWIGTADSGVFLISPNGQETKCHFTQSNSPLPSNSVNDIAINSKTGEVFIATAKGLVSFKGMATGANLDLNNVYVFPNPVRPEYEGTVKISGLLDKANIKITDIVGNLVYETTSEGGTIEWDTTAFGKYKVASGVYMIFISAQDGVETKVKKVMIVR
jgi:ligand-binding sensor domain-containing protein